MQLFILSLCCISVNLHGFYSYRVLFLVFPSGLQESRTFNEVRLFIFAEWALLITTVSSCFLWEGICRSSRLVLLLVGR